MDKRRTVLHVGAIAAMALGILFASTGTGPRPVFSPAAMRATAKEALDSGSNLDPNHTMNAVVRILKRDFGKHIMENEPWVFNNAGGAMGALKVLHYSFTEYVILFGTSVGTEGHTGRFFADDYFTILYGEQWAFSAGSTEKEIYRPGDQHFLPRGTAKQYRMPNSTWALEYAHGNMLSMWPFGLADALFSTLDFVSVYRMTVSAVKGLVTELLQGKV